MSKSIAATINVEIWNEELDVDDISDQIDALGWTCDFIQITHSDYDDSVSED